MRPPGAALAAALVATGLTGGAAAEQPPVLAAWSQVFGAQAAAGGPIAPVVELRFVLPDGADCGAFEIERRLAEADAWTPAPRAASRNGAEPPLAIEVCALPMADAEGPWRSARLTFEGVPARLASEVVLGNDEATIGEGFAPGPSDGALEVVALGDTGCRGVPRVATKPGQTPADAARSRGCGRIATPPPGRSS